MSRCRKTLQRLFYCLKDSFSLYIGQCAIAYINFVENTEGPECRELAVGPFSALPRSHKMLRCSKGGAPEPSHKQRQKYFVAYEA